MPLVSVIMPVRDAGPFLEPALRSVLDQTVQDLEVVVVDDGSRDGSCGVVAAAARRDPRVLLLPATGRGVAAALNQAIAAAQSPYLARMDADDLSHPRRLSRQLALLDTNPQLAGCGTAVVHVDRKGRRLPALLRSVPVTPLGTRVCAAISTPLLHPTAVLRADLVRACDGYREDAPLEDLDLWLRLLAHGHDLVNLDEPLLHYRVHGGNTTSRARTVGAAQLVGSSARHASSVLGRAVAEDQCALLLDPRSASTADRHDVEQALAVLGELVAIAAEDRAAVRDRALSTAAVMAASRLRSGHPPPPLDHTGLSTGAVLARMARGAHVGARRWISSRPRSRA